MSASERLEAAEMGTKGLVLDEQRADADSVRQRNHPVNRRPIELQRCHALDDFLNGWRTEQSLVLTAQRAAVRA